MFDQSWKRTDYYRIEPAKYKSVPEKWFEAKITLESSKLNLGKKCISCRSYAVEIKLRIADQEWWNINNCLTIIARLRKRSRNFSVADWPVNQNAE